MFTEIYSDIKLKHSEFTDSGWYLYVQVRNRSHQVIEFFGCWYCCRPDKSNWISLKSYHITCKYRQS